MKTLYRHTTILLLAGTLIIACNKDSFLSKKLTTSIIVPTSLTDLRSMLDNTEVFTIAPGIGEISADNYYMTYANWQAQIDIPRNLYNWAPDIMAGNQSLDDWNDGYQQVLYANIVLEQLAKLTPAAADIPEWNNIHGSALFLRSLAYFNMVTHFAAAYDSSSAGTDAGIPIRETTDIHILSQRSSIKASYDKIFADLNTAITLLSDAAPVTAKNRPSKPACYALLSRVALNTHNYALASLYCDSCLNLYNKLIDYNTLSTTASAPFDRSNIEIIFYGKDVDYELLEGISTSHAIDTTLYQSYAANDLRKVIFFRTISGTTMGIKRGYTGSIYAFGGLCVDEVYITRAECQARAGNIIAAMNDLNTVLSKRWKTNTYVNITAASASDALSKILVERRKEMIWRGVRWLDIKRLNKEGAGIVLQRILNGATYTLTPNSPLYVFPIPDNEISQSGIKQNPR